MAYVKYSNGVVLEWDENISVGSLITTYNDGYHILTEIQFREEKPVPKELEGTIFGPRLVESSDPFYTASPIFHYTKVLKGDGTKSKAIRASCDASYCRKVTKDWTETQRAREVALAEAKAAAIATFL